VSFDRPYADSVHWRNLWYDEYPLVRFLERNGVDVSYATDADVSRDPASLRRHPLVIFAGHGEYWTKDERDAAEAARDAGVNLAFMGANMVYWQVRYVDGGSTMVGYKSAADPIADKTLTTDRFRDLATPRPECSLIGVQYDGTSWDVDADHPDDAFGVVDASLGNPWFAGTGFAPGATVADSVGYEWDKITPGCATPPLTRLFHWNGAEGLQGADSVTYTAPSGARVFAAGTLQWAQALDGWRQFTPPVASDPRMERFTLNLLSDLGAGEAPEGPPRPPRRRARRSPRPPRAPPRPRPRPRPPRRRRSRRRSRPRRPRSRRPRPPRGTR
jgi:hypothetical protein